MARASKHLTEILGYSARASFKGFSTTAGETPTPDISILKEGRAGRRRWNRIYRNHANRPGSQHILNPFAFPPIGERDEKSLRRSKNIHGRVIESA
jgi:hypothetical protein